LSGAPPGGAEEPGPPPLPPPDLRSRALHVDTCRAGALLYRIHPVQFGSVFFGPAADARPRGRWDAPDRAFRVCYLAEAAETAFAETFLRTPGLLLLDPADLAQRGLARILVTRDLRLASMYGAGLARAGTTAAVCSGPYGVSRAWAAALHEHPSRLDGIRYRARHDDDGLAVAVFDRAADALDEIDTRPLDATDASLSLGRWLDRYGVGLA
jgi:hypothetical protein